MDRGVLEAELPPIDKPYVVTRVSRVTIRSVLCISVAATRPDSTPTRLLPTSTRLDVVQTASRSRKSQLQLDFRLESTLVDNFIQFR